MTGVAESLADLLQELHTVDGLHHEIDERDVVLSLLQRIDRIAGILEAIDHKADRFEADRESLENIFLVVDDEGPAALIHAGCACRMGSRTVKVDPLSTSLSTLIRPPYNSTTSLAIANPSPTLPGVVSNERLT